MNLVVPQKVYFGQVSYKNRNDKNVKLCVGGGGMALRGGRMACLFSQRAQPIGLMLCRQKSIILNIQTMFFLTIFEYA